MNTTTTQWWAGPGNKVIVTKSVSNIAESLATLESLAAKTVVRWFGLPCSYCLQIFLHSCEIKSGSGLGTRLTHTMVYMYAQWVRCTMCMSCKMHVSVHILYTVSTCNLHVLYTVSTCNLHVLYTVSTCNLHVDMYTVHKCKQCLQKQCLREVVKVSVCPEDIS